MKALIIYDSFFGNTEKIAFAIRDALGPDNAEAIKVENFKPEQINNLDLLIAGSPTRAFRPTKPISDCLKALPADSLKGISVCSFDTRASMDDINSGFLKTMVNFLGYAAEPLSTRLVKKGGKQLLAPEGFLVTGEKGPLKDGELQRAIDWAVKISGMVIG